MDDLDLVQLIAAQVQDEGQVICQAYNDFGEDLAKADLHIKGKDLRHVKS